MTSTRLDEIRDAVQSRQLTTTEAVELLAEVDRLRAELARIRKALLPSDEPDTELTVDLDNYPLF